MFFRDTWVTFTYELKKIKNSNPPPPKKKFPIFQKMELWSSNIGKFLIFSQRKAFLIFPEMKLFTFQSNLKWYKYPLGENSLYFRKRKPWKNVLYFSQKDSLKRLLIFYDMELFNPTFKKLLGKKTFWRTP